MPELANPRHRVWFEVPDASDRDALFDRAAGVLMRLKPEATALESLEIYPPGEGGDAGSDGVTIMWELLLAVDEAEGRDWDWGHAENARLAESLRRELSA